MRVALLALGAALLGLVTGIWLARRGRTRRPARAAGSDGPPALEWLLRANAALGAWLVGPGSREVVTPHEGLAETVDRAVQARLDHHRSDDGQRVERLEPGTLVMACRDGRAAALLLPEGNSTGERATALRDLARLLDIVPGRASLPDLPPAEGTVGESVASVAVRLAMQVERIMGAEVWVVTRKGDLVQVAGLSLRSDQRLLGVPAAPDCALAQVAIGAEGARSGVREPLGHAVADRRRRKDAAYVCPIEAHGVRIGALAVWSEEGREPSGALMAGLHGALEAAGPRFAAAFERQHLLEEARRDPLTRLLNRRGLENEMGSVAVGIGALVYLDLDHFKALNDRLGHPAGDAALIHVARLLEQAVRTGDSAARIGGEEFALWLPGATLERARQVAERIRQSLAWGDFSWEGELVRLSASFGVAACPETTATKQGLPAQADAALYSAKRGGRDRVETAPPG